MSPLPTKRRHKENEKGDVLAERLPSSLTCRLELVILANDIELLLRFLQFVERLGVAAQDPRHVKEDVGLVEIAAEEQRARTVGGNRDRGAGVIPGSETDRELEAVVLSG